MQLKTVGQVTLGAKSIKIPMNTREIEERGTAAGIATFYINLAYLRDVIDGTIKATTISQLVLRKDRTRPPPKAYTVAGIRRSYPKAYAKWTEQENEKLRTLLREGHSIGELAQIFQRKKGAIRSRLIKFRLLD